MRVDGARPAAAQPEVTGTPQMARLAAEMVVPVRWDDASPSRPGPAAEEEFAAYLDSMARWCDVTVVDGSVGDHAAVRRAGWARTCRVLTPDPRWAGSNGKVTGAVTGIEAARHDRVVLADDDVRYDGPTLQAVVAALDDADVVRPQNVSTQWPWWARWESGRILLNRAFDADWPGTFGVRREAVVRAGGWSAEALFENLEMVRTVRAVGGRFVSRPDILVHRTPPPLRHFLRQRVRQAYEDQAQPWRLAAGLLVVPAVAAGLRRPRALAIGAAVLVALAEAGRRRDGGATSFPPSSSLFAPLWVLERGVCTLAALVQRVRGGIVYHGRRMPLAAHSSRALRARHRAAAPTG
jgi:Glycosyltransferase like family 2